MKTHENFEHHFKIGTEIKNHLKHTSLLSPNSILMSFLFSKFMKVYAPFVADQPGESNWQSPHIMMLSVFFISDITLSRNSL